MELAFNNVAKGAGDAAPIASRHTVSVSFRGVTGRFPILNAVHAKLFERCQHT